MAPSLLMMTAPIRFAASTSTALRTRSVGFIEKICGFALESMMLRTITPASPPSMAAPGQVSSAPEGLSSSRCAADARRSRKDGLAASRRAQEAQSASAARIQSTTTSAMRLIRATRASSWWRTR